MDSYHTFVSEFGQLMAEGKNLPLGGFTPLPRLDFPEDAPKALIFSPHPDDECIIGGLALRLMRQSGFRVVNVAVTQGSKKERQQARLEELKEASRHIQFELIQTAENGLEKINPKGKAADPENWKRAVDITARILKEQKPEVIFFPHDEDNNTTHIGTHHLTIEALQTLGDSFSTWTVETEFWGPMKSPNLMVESSKEELADLLAALSFHVGEVQRNPYHLRTPAWMMDNVRRGGEVVGGQGGAAPDFLFATLYRLRRWENGALREVLDAGRVLPAAEDPRTLFKT